MSLQIVNVKKQYRGKPILENNFVLKGISYELESGQVLAIVGQNGTGKSTLIKCILNFLKPDVGTISIDGIPIEGVIKSGKVGYMPESFIGPEIVSVRQYIEDLLILRGLNLDDYKERLEELSERFFMKKHLDKPFSKCSKGTVKKVIFLQAILHNPTLLVLDEPTDGLDPVSRRIMLEEIRKIKEKGGTVIITTHLLSDLSLVSDKVIVLKGGKIIAEADCKEIPISLEDWYFETLIKNGGIDEL